MKVQYRFRLYPTPEQELRIRQFAGNERWLWNFLVDYSIRLYTKSNTYLTYQDLCSRIVLLKQQFAWIKNSPSQALLNVAKELNGALQRYYKTGTGCPQFRRKSSTMTIQFPQHIRTTTRSTVFPKLGEVKTVFHREIPPTWDISSAKLIVTNDNYYVEFSGDISPRKARRLGISVTNAIGCVYTDNTFSDTSGPVITVPRSVCASNRRISTSRPRDRNRHIRRSTNLLIDFYHRMARYLLMRGDLICVSTTQKTNEWGIFMRILSYKAEKYGKLVIHAEGSTPEDTLANGYKQYRCGGGILRRLV